MDCKTELRYLHDICLMLTPEIKQYYVICYEKIKK